MGRTVPYNINMNYPRIVLAGTHSGVGKTTLTLGIILALRKKGLKVQPFKVGPDYIDPTYHTQVSGSKCCNLDTWLLSRNTILELFQKRAKHTNISVIEGVMGLYDGLRDSQKGSTAHLSKVLDAPVILILDARSLSRSAAAIVLGYKEFDGKVKIKGIILNNIGSKNHYQYVKNAIETRVKIPVLGCLPKNAGIKLPERHLGLVPAPERQIVRGVFCKKLVKLIEENIDIDSVVEISKKANKLSLGGQVLTFDKICQMSRPDPLILIASVKVAVARDKAFNFYYEDNLDILKNLGAKLIEFSPMDHKKLPRGIDGIYIGGGFPELFASKLSKNIKLKKEIYEKAKAGLPIYAECGGLMYLVEKLINFKKKSFPMVGIFPGSVDMAGKLRALGYVNVEIIKDNILSKKGQKNKAHMFHWSYLDRIPETTQFAYRIKKGKDKIFHDGLVNENVLASYTHLHFASNISFARNFVKSCVKYGKKNKQGL